MNKIATVLGVVGGLMEKEADNPILEHLRRNAMLQGLGGGALLGGAMGGAGGMLAALPMGIGHGLDTARAEREKEDGTPIRSGLKAGTRAALLTPLLMALVGASVGAPVGGAMRASQYM